MNISSPQGAASAIASAPVRAPQPREVAAAPSAPPAPVLQDAQDNLLRAAQALREALGPLFRTEPHFSVDAETKRLRIEIVDDSGEIVRQIPAEAVERFAKSLDRYIGVMVDEIA